MVQIIEQCNCGSTHVRWESDFSPVSGKHEYLRCQRCGNTLRAKLNPMPWLFLLMAAGAAIYGWWLVTRWPS